MEGRELERPLITWFNAPFPFPTVPKGWVTKQLPKHPPAFKDGTRLVWLGGEPIVDGETLQLHHAEGVEIIHGQEEELEWMLELLDAARPDQEPVTFREAQQSFPRTWKKMKRRWWRIRRAGLIGI